MPLFGPPNVEQLIAKNNIQGLINALSNQKDYFVRSMAEQALVQMGAKQKDPVLPLRTIKLLIAALKDEKVSLIAIRVLGQIGEELDDTAHNTLIVEALINMFTSNTYSIRWEAAVALEKIGTVLEDAALRARIIEALKILLNDRELDMRNTAVRLLEEIGWKPGLDKISTDYWSVKVEKLITELKTGNRDEMDGATAALGKIGAELDNATIHTHIIDSLTTALSDSADNDNSTKQAAAACALGRIGDPSAINSLNDALKSHSRYVCEAAAKALGQIPNPGSIEPLLAAYKVYSGDRYNIGPVSVTFFL